MRRCWGSSWDAWPRRALGLAIQRWLCERSGPGEPLDVDDAAMSLMPFYRASDVLMRPGEALEATRFARVGELFGLDWTVTLYDLTNTHFEGEAPSNRKARRVHSKVQGSDCPLLTLGLVLDNSGFVRRCEVFDGNVLEGTTLAGMLHHRPRGRLSLLEI